ncbi:hypothetical protein [Thermococcus sp.]|uniref:hypothetical protein n=1 Tax=Thermococcus sp. TaxID=35749 RepID=UPI0025F68D3C|nr:hypothetical protein [Thermococcus sp.]
MENNIGLGSPEEMEHLAFKKFNDGKIKDGLKLLLRAAKGYENEGMEEDAARLYKYLGLLLVRKIGSIEKARPSLLKSAYLYLDLIDSELAKPEVNVDLLDEYCTNVLEIFLTLRDEKNLIKYTEEFTTIYEDLAEAYRDNADIPMAIKAYEIAYIYYRLIGNEKGYKRISETMITLYGQLAEEKLEKGDVEKAADAFYRLATFIHAIFGYDIHFIEMMDTAAKNYEKAGKLAYSSGNLSKTTSLLVKAQYSYLLARNMSRAKLIGINTVKILNQIVKGYRSAGDEESASKKLVELSEALIGIGKIEEGIEAYKKALEALTGLSPKTRIRLAMLKKFASDRNDEEILEEIELIEYYLSRGNESRALDIAKKALLTITDIEGIIELLHRAEGIYD